jgi:hypothetical protein
MQAALTNSPLHLGNLKLWRCISLLHHNLELEVGSCQLYLPLSDLAIFWTGFQGHSGVISWQTREERKWGRHTCSELLGPRSDSRGEPWPCVSPPCWERHVQCVQDIAVISATTREDKHWVEGLESSSDPSLGGKAEGRDMRLAEGGRYSWEETEGGKWSPWNLKQRGGDTQELSQDTKTQRIRVSTSNFRLCSCDYLKKSDHKVGRGM